MRKVAVYLFSFVMWVSPIYARDVWTTYTKPESINDIAADGVYLWCATTSGLVKWNTADSTYTVYTTSDGLPENRIETVDVAPNGIVWCGTRGGGVASLEHGIWTTYTTDDGLLADYIWSMDIDYQGQVWVSNYIWYSEYYYGGLSRFNGVTWDSFPLSGMKSPLRSVKSDPNGMIWGTMLTTVFRFDGAEWTQYSAENGLVGNFILRLDIGPDGNPWYVCDGIGRFNGEKWLFQPDGAIGDVYAILVEPDSTVWCGVNRQIIRIKGDQMTHFPVTEQSGNNFVTSIVSGPDNGMWFGTWEGMDRLRGDGVIFYEMDKMLADEMVWCFALDHEGTVWCGGRAGASCYDGLSWKTYSYETGMLRGTVVSIAVDTNDYIWRYLQNSRSKTFTPSILCTKS